MATKIRGTFSLAVALLCAATTAFATGAARAGSGAEGAVLGEVAAPVRQSLKQQLLVRDPAPLWQWLDPDLEEELTRSISAIGLAQPLREGKLAVALVDTTDLAHPRVAAINGDRMLYAASLPKIAVMLGAFRNSAQTRNEFLALLHT